MSNQCLKTAFVSLFNMRKDNDKRGARVVIAVLLITEALEAYVVLFFVFSGDMIRSNRQQPERALKRLQHLFSVSDA